jgi:hypothetical protein
VHVTDRAVLMQASDPPMLADSDDEDINDRVFPTSTAAVTSSLSAAPMAAADNTQGPICRWFQKGKCRYGATCRQLHVANLQHRTGASKPQPAATAVAPSPAVIAAPRASSCSICKLVLGGLGADVVGPTCSQCAKSEFCRSCLVYLASTDEPGRRVVCTQCVKHLKLEVTSNAGMAALGGVYGSPATLVAELTQQGSSPSQSNNATPASASNSPGDEGERLLTGLLMQSKGTLTMLQLWSSTLIDCKWNFGELGEFVQSRKTVFLIESAPYGQEMCSLLAAVGPAATAKEGSSVPTAMRTDVVGATASPTRTSVSIRTDGEKRTLRDYLASDGLAMYFETLIQYGVESVDDLGALNKEVAIFEPIA